MGGLLFAVVLVASQANAWIHAVVIAHVACPEHGEAIHGPARTADQERVARAVGGGVVEADVAAGVGHDHCANAALLRWRDVTLPARSGLTAFAPAARFASSAPGYETAHAAGVYRLAPKTSPPAA
jgi:hypothetical protein